MIVLFGFTPCSVKQGVFDVFSLEYHRTVNVNKTSQNTYCASTIVNQVVTQKQNKQRLLKSVSAIVPSFVYKEISKKWNEKELFGRDPPLYILYLKLKIAPFFTRNSFKLFSTT